MGIICLYVLIQKSAQKTAKSHLCALRALGSEYLRSCFLLIEESREGAFFFLSTRVKDNTSLIKKQTRPKPRVNKQIHSDTFLNQTL